MPRFLKFALCFVISLCPIIFVCCEKEENVSLVSNSNPVEGYPYFASHLFIDKIFANSNAIIPCQSLSDIEIAARLGFPSIELNVHETLDGRFVTIHGVKGCFGDQVIKRDGSSVSSIPISSVEYSFIRDNLVYRSLLSEYQTSIPTLEDALEVCERHRISPYISGSYNEKLFEIVANYNVTPIWGCYSSKDAIKTRKRTADLITCWSSLRDIDEIVSLCTKVGSPYIHYIASEVLHDANSLSWSEYELNSLVKRVHETGASLGFAGCYTPVLLTNKLWELGFDYASSGWAVNAFSRGNLINAESLYSSSIVTNGSFLNESLSLLNNEVLSVQCDTIPFLSKGVLSFTIEGRIHLKMGSYINVDIESERKNYTFSTYFLNQKPVFEIVSMGETDIFSLSFFVDEC